MRGVPKEYAAEPASTGLERVMKLIRTVWEDTEKRGITQGKNKSYRKGTAIRGVVGSRENGERGA